MKTKMVLLGKTRLKVLAMGLGGIPIQKLSFPDSDRLLEKAVELGIIFFDTARVYTDSEAKFGRILSRYRQQVVMASKSLSREKESMIRDIDISLQNLKTDWIDIYQCHNVASKEELAKVLAAGGALEGLLAAQKAGKIGHVGISGHKPRLLAQALEQFDFATIQIPFNFIETAALEKLIPLAREKRVGIVAMKPLGGGNIKAVRLNFRFIFNHGIDVAIPGMDRISQVRENVGVLQDLSPLSERESRVLAKEKDFLGENFCRRCEYCLPCPQGLPIAFLHVLKNYYFVYDLKDWVRERLKSMDKSFKDCSGCGECLKKCPYRIDSPGIFKETWGKIVREQKI